VIATLLRGSAVREYGRFVARELLRRPVVGTYRARSTDRRFFLRHDTPDVVTMDEIFYRRDYEPPREVAATLATAPAPSILDLGANIGLFGVFILERFPAARVVAFEPDQANVDILRRCAAANGGAPRWTVVTAAASNSDGSVRFLSGGVSLSRISDSAEGELVPALDVFPYLSEADLAKVDIEGGEWVILGDPRLRTLGPPALVLEYHPYLSPEADPRACAIRLLGEAGYECRPSADDRGGHGIVWALRPDYERAPTASSSRTGTPPTTG